LFLAFVFIGFLPASLCVVGYRTDARLALRKAKVNLFLQSRWGILWKNTGFVTWLCTPIGG
jgi:hypothetical protein